ncbi:winged helix-turn-helix domain-containing protein [Streptomyces sp. NPDC008222]|uniref:helix-turn-helix domain-containing protein n=1 Tax=Streptomyces sp. NPDC008222 TaxID=3364820 RepID=UPI0036EEB461
MTAASQWLPATTGRIATCAHSWMTAVHWAGTLAAKGLYTPTQKHGPKWGPTTVAVAQEISALKECRPSVDYLARKLKTSARTIKYHLAMLRETGLLVYRSKGTRLSGVGGRASEFERVIPVAFDEALGIRTVGEGATRRPVGAAEESRSLLGKLAKKAARKARRRPRRTTVSGRGRCTPMQGGTSSRSSAAGTYSPSESKLASGRKSSPTPKQSKRGPRTLNRVGRRYQLARELIQLVPWLHGASTPRIAWIIRHVADAGWSAIEVQAAAERIVSEKEPRRPSGLLAYRLASCHLLYTTKDRRKVLVDEWRDSRVAEKARHSGNDELTGTDRRPAAVSVQRIMREAFRRVNEIAAGPIDDADCFEIPVETAPEPVALEDLGHELVLASRAEAAKDHRVILNALESGMTELDARRLYTHWLVDQALGAQRRAELTPAF